MNLTRRDIRRRALAYAGESDKTSYYQGAVDDWIDDALQEMQAGMDGVEDTWTVVTVAGMRAYLLPDGFLRPKLVLFNGEAIPEIQLEAQDFYSGGNSDPAWYTIWGWPLPSILLGPQPPASAKTLTVYHHRAPLRLVSDDSVPELPGPFQPSLSFYAAAQIKLSDEDPQTADLMMRQFNQSRLEFRRFMVDNSRSNYQQVLRIEDY